MTNTISHLLTKTMSISEAEKEISKYTDGTPIAITYLENTTEAWELADLSDYRRLTMLTPGIIKAGKSTELTKLIEDLGISKSTRVAFTPTQIDLTIKIEDPIISILAAFKKMCERRLKVMLETIQHDTHPRSQKEAIEIAITTIFRNWDKQGGYRDAIAKVTGINNKDSIKCTLIGETLRKELRNPAEHERHNLTTDDVKYLVRKIQKLTPKDIIITDTKPTSTRKQPHSL